MSEGEHEVTETLKIDVYYPDHAARAETPEFRRAKVEEAKESLVCCICGSPNPELHHALVEWAFSDDADWAEVQQIALGNRDIINGIPKMQSALYWLLQVVRLRGFNWATFDPAHPEAFVDNLAQMAPLCAEHHRAPDKGIHMTDFPLFIFQAFPKKKGLHEFKDGEG
ncbi:MAG: hypothetical protein ACYC0Z_16445 [Acidobacteriaceae bacterium]